MATGQLHADMPGKTADRQGLFTHTDRHGTAVPHGARAEISVKSHESSLKRNVI
jgi:hypothetical protein